MASTILATFDTTEQAHDAIRDLTNSGFPRQDIGLAVYNAEDDFDPNTSFDDVKAGEGVGVGATFGAIFGAVVGLGTIVVPGIGPVIAAGPLSAALGALAGAGIGAASGAVTGGITASLVKLGVPENEADYYAESIRRGAALVTITAHEGDAERAMRILQTHNPIDMDRRVVQWRNRGWEGFDPMVDPYTAEDLETERNHFENDTFYNEDDEALRREREEADYYGVRRYDMR